MTGTTLMDEATLARLTAETSAPMVEHMLQLFVQEARRRMDRLRGCLLEADCDGAAGEAHNLKSNAATFGACRLSTLARELESACQGADRAQAERLLPEAEGTLAETLALYCGRYDIAPPG